MRQRPLPSRGCSAAGVSMRGSLGPHSHIDPERTAQGAIAAGLSMRPHSQDRQPPAQLPSSHHRWQNEHVLQCGARSARSAPNVFCNDPDLDCGPAGAQNIGTTIRLLVRSMMARWRRARKVSMASMARVHPPHRRHICDSSPGARNVSVAPESKSRAVPAAGERKFSSVSLERTFRISFQHILSPSPRFFGVVGAGPADRPEPAGGPLRHQREPARI